ncbi:MAG: Eco57I restriction-modification methylase domain-containing protein [Candidatus Lokiarchaeota archaeon]|nr:Eco57I restriction-modification methylase domain-containing protein [Candidatus Lokiarchaeota archaeon]
MVLKNNNKRGYNLIGQIFTPKYIAKFMVNNISNFITTDNKTHQDLKVLEPSVGEGIFLKSLIQNNFSDITAYEMDNSLKTNLLKNYPQVKFNFENFLGSDLNEKFDIIIGNPPYLGQNYNAKVFQDYIKKFPICKKFFVGNMDLFYYFIHLGILKLKPGGILSFITTNYWITKSRKTGIKLLKPHILEECFLLQYIDLSNMTLFKGAEGQHNCIFILRKKTDLEKQRSVNKPIQVIQITKNGNSSNNNENFNTLIFKEVLLGNDNRSIRKYRSAITNNDLKPDRSWNLLYPEEIKEIIDDIEKSCIVNGKISYLKDRFIVRNGIIFIKDNLFILNEVKNLKIEKQDVYIKINNIFVKILNNEKERLKKIYKSKSIKPYSYNEGDHTGYAIYFNKNEFNGANIEERNLFFEEKYPNLIQYLKQYKTELRNILVNAKENPNDYFFPRRGTFIRRNENNSNETLIDLEPFYEKGKKIFFKYISNENIFGYSKSSYFATSDTYFLWPRFNQKSIDYTFMLAYLNSKLVRFLFNAKNIRIKRSKTKLEDDLPIPFIENFTSEKDCKKISLIKKLTKQLVQSSGNRKEIQVRIDKLIFDLFKVKEKEINLLFNFFYNY